MNSFRLIYIEPEHLTKNCRIGIYSCRHARKPVCEWRGRIDRVPDGPDIIDLRRDGLRALQQ